MKEERRREERRREERRREERRPVSEESGHPEVVTVLRTAQHCTLNSILL